MKHLTYVALAAIMTLAPIGCSSTSTTAGGKGGDDTFKLKAPALATTIHQGKTETVKLSIVRGKDFKSDLKLTADHVPTGVKVELKPAMIKAADTADFTAEVTAAADAAVGEHKISIKGTPTSGSATTVDINIKIEK